MQHSHFAPLATGAVLRPKRLVSNVSTKELRPMNLNRKLTGLAVSLLLLIPAAVWAQSFQASVSGIVTDPTGAVVPTVKITVTDTERGVSLSAIANQDGVYVINNLIPSTYTITA